MPEGNQSTWTDIEADTGLSTHTSQLSAYIRSAHFLVALPSCKCVCSVSQDGRVQSRIWPATIIPWFHEQTDTHTDTDTHTQRHTRTRTHTHTHTHMFLCFLSPDVKVNLNIPWVNIRRMLKDDLQPDSHIIIWFLVLSVYPFSRENKAPETQQTLMC